MYSKEPNASVLDSIEAQDVSNNTNIDSSTPTTPQPKPNDAMLIVMFLVVFGFGGVIGIGSLYLFKESLGPKPAVLIAAAVALLSDIVILLMFVF
jgi:hypothetical protein